MSMPFSTVFAQTFSLLRILYLFCSMAHALSAESFYDFFDLSQTDLSFMNLNSANLDFWNGGGDLQSQSNQFVISLAEVTFLSNIESDSADFFDFSLSFPNDSFQAVSSDCQVNAMNSNEIAQNIFEVSDEQIDARSDLKSFSASKNFRRSDLTFENIFNDQKHKCLDDQIAVCCVTE